MITLENIQERYDETALVQYLRKLIDTRRYVYTDVDLWINCKSSMLYVIKYGQQVVGLLNYEILKPDNTCKTFRIYINCIEIDEEYRYRGFGRAVIKILLNQTYAGHRFTSLVGEATPQAIAFWRSIGANFGINSKRLQFYVDNNLMIPFTVTKRGMQKKYK